MSSKKTATLIHRRDTKLIPKFHNKPYEERLRELKSPFLENRQVRNQLNEVFKMINGFDNLKFKNLFESNINKRFKQIGIN